MDYEKYFDKDVPEYLKVRAIAIMKRFCINGLCDGMYICNVIANQNGMGNGASEFNGEEKHIDYKTAEFLQSVYGSNIFFEELSTLADILSTGKLNMFETRKALIQRIALFKKEIKRCDEWRVDYLKNCIKNAQSVLETL